MSDLKPVLKPLKGNFENFESLCDCNYEHDGNGKPILTFSIAIANIGTIPLWIILGKIQTDKDGNTVAPAQQKIHQTDGTDKFKDVGFFIQHREIEGNETHIHWHYKGIASIDLIDKSGKLVASSKKEGYCLADSYPYTSKSPALFSPNGCEQKTEVGLTVGWADQYYRETEDQYIEIENVPNGKYDLKFSIKETAIVYDFEAPVILEVEIDHQTKSVKIKKDSC